MRKSNETIGSLEYFTYYFNYLDTTSVDNAKDFLEFVKSGGKTKLEKMLIPFGYVGESMMNELIATKYMRLNDYDSAIVYLEKVKPFFWKKQNITEFLKRNPFIEEWISTESEKASIYKDYNPARIYAGNPTKLQFCKIMSKLEHLVNESANDEEKATMNYAYAVGLAQSTGYCWALTQYSKSADPSFWTFEFYINLRGISDLKYIDNNWDYKSSNSYMLQKKYKTIYSILSDAENATTDENIAARCQYMRGLIELDKSHKSQYYHGLLNKYAETKFIKSEIHHCDVLANYRNTY